MKFIRLGEKINKKQDMRVVSVTVIPTVKDCSGTVWFTDLMLQEGGNLTGYWPHTEYALEKWPGDDENETKVWYNGIVRSSAAVVLLNLGGTAAGLDVHIFPRDAMAADTVSLSQGAGGQKVSFPQAMSAEDDVALLADERKCTKNGADFNKKGFFQYSAAWDSKHNVTVEDGKSARLLFEIQQMQDGGVKY